MSTPRKPDLDRLVTALTADGRPDELAGRDAAAAAFRAARPGVTRPTGRPGSDGWSIAPTAHHAAPAAGRHRGRRDRRRRWSPRRPTRGRCPARRKNLRTPCSRRSASQTISSPATRPPSPSRRREESPGEPRPAERPRRLRPGREPATSSPWPCRGPACRPAAGRDHRTGHRIRPRRGRGAGRAVRTARRFRSVASSWPRG